MIIGNNIPTGIEKVTIDGEKVREKLNLYSFQHQVVLDINAPQKPSPEYKYQGQLYDNSELYLKSVCTSVEDGNLNSSAGCTGTILLIKPDKEELSIDIPNYNIPSTRSKTELPGYYNYACELFVSPDNKIYLIIIRRYHEKKGSVTVDTHYYFSIYRLNITASKLSWTQKVIELYNGTGNNHFGYGNFNNPYFIEENYFYIVNSSSFQHRIYGYKYEDQTYQLSQLNTNRSLPTNNSSPLHLVRKGNDLYTYICFTGTTISSFTDGWISITRGQNEIYSETSGMADFSHSDRTCDLFMLNGEVYIHSTMDYNKKQKGISFYRLNDDMSKWEEILKFFSDDNNGAHYHNSNIETYIDGTPKYIFYGEIASDVDRGEQGIVRRDGTFDLIMFYPKSPLEEYTQIITPIVNNKNTYGNSEDWRLYKFLYNDNNQKVFFFDVQPNSDEYGYIYYTKYCCVLEAMDNTPIIYSTFKEQDLIN